MKTSFKVFTVLQTVQDCPCVRGFRISLADSYVQSDKALSRRHTLYLRTGSAEDPMGLLNREKSTLHLERAARRQRPPVLGQGLALFGKGEAMALSTPV